MRKTVQKQVILSTVLASCDHPDAETICERARAVIPSISLGTVYRNLAQLAADGKLKRISIPDSGDRFDKNVEEHAHFHCLGCGKVIDVNLNFEQMDSCKEFLTEKMGVTLTKITVVMQGYCSDCAKGE
ncbi:MAG: transcriptional repressor [Clostridiales bacterium]|nr:transcriptional repressor [Clostridiales bacterium]